MQISLSDGIAYIPEGKSIFDVLRAIGISAFEARIDTDYSIPRVKLADGSTPFSVATPELTAQFKSRLDAEGITISALLLATDFSGDDAEKHVEWATRCVYAAKELGAPAVRIDTATRNSSLTMEQVRDNFIQRVSRVLQATADSGIDLGIENHGGVSNNPDFLTGVFAEVGDDRLGMTLDTGNFYWYGFPLQRLYEVLEQFAPRAKHTHIKNINYPVDLAETQRAIGYEYGKYSAPLDEGNIEMSRVVGILRDAGYDRDLCIEDESLGKFPEEQRIDVLRRNVKALQDAL